MLRTILIIGLLASISGADITVGKLYKAIPKEVNNEDVSPRTKYRYTIHFRAIEGFNRIKVTSKVQGNLTLNYYKSKNGSDYYKDSKSKMTVSLDRHGKLFIWATNSNGVRKADWLRLSYSIVRAKLLGSTYIDKWGKKYTVCDKIKGKLRVIEYTRGTDYSLCSLPMLRYYTHTEELYDLYDRRVREGASGYNNQGTWRHTALKTQRLRSTPNSFYLN